MRLVAAVPAEALGSLSVGTPVEFQVRRLPGPELRGQGAADQSGRGPDHAADPDLRLTAEQRRPAGERALRRGSRGHRELAYRAGGAEWCRGAQRRARRRAARCAPAGYRRRPVQTGIRRRAHGSRGDPQRARRPDDTATGGRRPRHHPGYHRDGDASRARRPRRRRGHVHLRFLHPPTRRHHRGHAGAGGVRPGRPGALETDEFPEVNPPVVAAASPIRAPRPSAVEREVVDPIEEAIAGISGVDKIHSTSLDGFAMIIVEFVFERTCSRPRRTSATRSRRSAATCRRRWRSRSSRASTPTTCRSSR